MTKELIKITILLICLAACGQKGHTVDKHKLHDSVQTSPTSKLDSRFNELLTLLQETKLADEGQTSHEFRFYYFPAFGNLMFFKLNYGDSLLTVKEFVSKKPDGTGEDKLLSFETTKLLPKDILTLQGLIDKSMFYSLDQDSYRPSIDCAFYIYEIRQPHRQKIITTEKDYHIVRYNAPQNSDFVNLGQFFLFKTGHENTYKD